MYITLTNNFHNTETKIRWKDGATEHFFTSEQARRIGNRLCCVSDTCCCSGILGTRGPESAEIDGVEYDIDIDDWYQDGQYGLLLTLVSND